MTDLEAIEIVYNLAVRQIRGPVPDRELDALFHIRALLAQRNQLKDQSTENFGMIDEKGQWR